MVLAFAWPAAIWVGAQAPTAGAASTRESTAASRYVPKRLPDGQPDIQGVYLPSVTDNIMSPIERFTQAERDAYKQQMEKVRGPDVPAHGAEWTEGALRAQGSRVKMGTPLVVDPPDGRIPWQPWALAKRNHIRDNPYERPEFLDSRIRCLPGGTPRENLGGATNAFHVIQPPGHVVILYENNHIFRVIPLGGAPHPGPDIPLWMGDSRGRWDPRNSASARF